MSGTLALVLLVSASGLAAAASLRTWQPRPLARIAEGRPALAWMLPRLLLAAVALVALVAVRSEQPSFPDCPERAGIEDSGELLYGRLVVDTLVCVYEYTGGGL